MPMLQQLTDTIQTEGFAFVEAAAMRALLEQSGSLTDWDDFAASWGDLGLDTFMADGGRYRKRRHAAFRVDADVITRKPPQPHYQSRDYNPVNGGIERWFAPVLPSIGGGATLTTILTFCSALFGRLSPTPTHFWHVEVHQFRIEARLDQAGRPTPEGMHRDGVDYVLVLLINRQNISSGETSVHDLSGRTLGSFTLTRPFDAALVDDARVMHGVTPVSPLAADAPGYRDVLVVTYLNGGNDR